MTLDQKQLTPTFDVNKKMDEAIRMVENGKDIYFGVEFTQEEKRVLVPIIGNKMKIRRFYLEINRTNSIKEVLDKYRKGSGFPIKGLAGDSRFNPSEEEVFKGIITRIKGAWNNNKINIEEFEIALDNSIKLENEEKEFRAMANTEEAPIDRSEIKQIKTLLKEKLSALTQDRIDPLLLRDFVNNNDIRSMFVREFIKTVTSTGKIKLQRDSKTFLLVDDLLTRVINEISRR